MSFCSCGVLSSLKWVRLEIFDLEFFFRFEPIRAPALINRLKHFRILFQFRRDIRSQSCLCSVQHTAAPRWSPWCATYHWDHLRGVQHTVEIISAVCITLQRWSLRFATHPRDHLRGVEHTAEINCTPHNQSRNLHLSMVAFKETIRKIL